MNVKFFLATEINLPFHWPIENSELVLVNKFIRPSFLPLVIVRSWNSEQAYVFINLYIWVQSIYDTIAWYGFATFASSFHLLRFQEPHSGPPVPLCANIDTKQIDSGSIFSTFCMNVTTIQYNIIPKDYVLYYVWLFSLYRIKRMNFCTLVHQSSLWTYKYREVKELRPWLWVNLLIEW